MKHNPPDGYPVSSYCRSCGKDFAGDTYFEKHRTGVHEYTYSQGIALDPSVEDGRRCKTTEELLEDGMRPMTKEEMRFTQRHARRADYDVEMWFDPIEAERIKAVKRPISVS